MPGGIFFVVRKPPTPGLGPIPLNQWTDSTASADVITTASTMTLNGVERYDPVRFWNHWGHYLGSFEATMAVKVNTGTIASGLWTFFGYQNKQVTVNTSENIGMYVTLLRASVGGTYRIQFYNQAAPDSEYNTINADTWYYVKIVKNRVQMRAYIYNDSAMTDLRSTLSPSMAQMRRPQYWFGMHPKGDEITGDPIFTDIKDLNFVSRQTFTHGWNPDESHIASATDETGDQTLMEISGANGEYIKQIAGSQVNTGHSSYIANYYQDTRKKFYCEFQIIDQGSAATDEIRCGITSEQFSWISNLNHPLGANESWCLQMNGYQRNGSVGADNAGYTSAFNDGTNADVMGMALDLTNLATGGGKLWFHRNGIWGTTAGGVGNPATGVNAACEVLALTEGGIYVPAVSLRYANPKVKIIGNPNDFTYTPPSGFGPFRWMEDSDLQ